MKLFYFHVLLFVLRLTVCKIIMETNQSLRPTVLIHLTLSPSHTHTTSPLGNTQGLHRADNVSFFTGRPKLVRPYENVPYEFVLDSPAMSNMSCSS